MPPRSSLPSSLKKRKIQDEKTSHNTSSARIQKIEKDLVAAVASKSSLNPLADLLEITQDEVNVQVLTKAIYALYRVFVVVITSGLLSSGNGDENSKAVRTWLQERLHEYVDLLIGFLKDEDATLRKSALEILMSLQKHMSTSVSKTSSPQWHNSHFKQVVYGLLLCPPSSRGVPRSKRRKSDTSASVGDGKINSDVRDHFIDTWLSEDDDVRWFFLREAATLLNTYDQKQYPDVPANLLSFLERLATFPTESEELNKWWVEELGKRPPKVRMSGDDDEEEEEDGTNEVDDGKQADEEDDWRKFFEDEPEPKLPQSKDPKKPHVRLHKLSLHQSLHSLASHRAIFTRCWLALLPQLSLRDYTKEVKEGLATRALNVMHRGVLPHLTRAILVMDWIAGCVDYGGSVGLLALNGLFVLIKEYNLDYPSFYTKLYAFLDRDVLHLKHRARFFRMTELFLSSTLLPLTLLASFVKRLARLSLSAPPSAVVMIIPFTYNILKKHPALMVMIHRAEDVSEEEMDPFNNAEPNPTLTQAIDSSLWELYTHKQHYHSAVSTLAKIFEEPFTKPNYSLEDFLDHTYNTMFETEVKRKIKKEPAVAMEPTQKSWFLRSKGVGEGGEEDEGLGQRDLVDTLWTF